MEPEKRSIRRWCQRVCPSLLQGVLFVGVLLLLALPGAEAVDHDLPRPLPDARPPAPPLVPTPAERAPDLPVDPRVQEPAPRLRALARALPQSAAAVPEAPAPPMRGEAPDPEDLPVEGPSVSADPAPAEARVPIDPNEDEDPDEEIGSGSGTRAVRKWRDDERAGPGQTRTGSPSASLDATVGPVVPDETARLVELAGAIVFLAWVAVRALPVLGGSRLERAEVRDHPVRRDMLEHLEANPGATAGELGRVAGVGCGRAIYHLSILEREQLVRGRRLEGRRRYFPVGAPRIDESVLAVRDLARPERQTGRIVGVLRRSPGTSLSEIARLLGMSPGQAHYHVAKLHDVGIIYRVRRGRRVRHYLSTTGHELAGRTAAFMERDDAGGVAA